jgi:Flp pilus assembly protein TadD
MRRRRIFWRRCSRPIFRSFPPSPARKAFGIGNAGIRYREDPYQPFASVYRGLDNVLYPYQLLVEEKLGDCDDLTVLYAALLENCNIPVALISVPGHIFLMFDTGIHERQQDMLLLPERLYQIYNRHVWIPVEITAAGQSFDVAWENGAKNFLEYAAEGDMEIVEVRDAWSQYSAVTIPQDLKRSPPPVRDTIRVSYVRHIRQLREEYRDSLEQQLAKQIESRNRLALGYALNQQFDSAETHLRMVITQDPKNFIAYNNWGNVYFWQGKLDSAEAKYFKAVHFAKIPDDSLGVRLNLGALFYAVDSTETATQIVAEALHDSTDLVRVERLLGLKLSDIDLLKADKKQTKRVSAANMKRLALAAAGPKKPKKPPKEKTRPAGGKGDMSIQEIDNVFFWAR